MFVRVGISRTGESEAYVIDEWEKHRWMMGRWAVLHDSCYLNK